MIRINLSIEYLYITLINIDIQHIIRKTKTIPYSEGLGYGAVRV